MSVKYKSFLLAIISCLIVIFLTTILFNFVIFKYINSVENKDIKDGFQVLDFIFNREKDTMKKTAIELSNEDNINETTLKHLDLNFIVSVDANGKMVNNYTRDLDNETKNLLASKINNKSNKFNNMITFKSNYEVHSGIIIISGKVFFITATPIVTNSESSKSSGSLITGRYADNRLINYIDSVTKLNVKLIGIEDPDEIKNYKDKKNNGFITKYKQISDINGDKNVVSSITLTRDEYTLGKAYFKMFISIYLLVIIIIVYVAITWANKHILKRLKSLNEFIDSVSKTKNTQLRLDMYGNDEITNICNSINNMLFELDTAHKDIKTMDERFRIIMEATNDGYIDHNIKTNEIYISSEWRRFIGYDEVREGTELFKEYLSRIHPEYLENFKNTLSLFIHSKNDYFQIEYRIIKKSGNIIWVLHRGKIAERNSEGKAIRIVSTLQDITARKKYEEDILTLSFSDKLTGLKNRAYMERKFDDLDNQVNIDYSIIMGDVNGLKLVNDTFGHKEGDKLIFTIGKILRNECSNDDIIARWGGDEFIILIINKEYSYVSNLMQNIKNKCEEVKDFSFKISIALGNAEKNERLDSESVMNLAEERMYRSKLTEMKSSRSEIIMSLEKTLYEKHSETEEHTQRIKVLSVKLGEKINLTQDKLNELELLSLLHDIGKIGIPEQILQKPDKLTAEEWEIMKSHTEIGYRIAKATPGLAHVANAILSHHERYDGKGYPQGLKGEDIPLLSRIINIVDSFDVMTNKRVYKEAASLEYAVGEIKRCSGTQFDPFIANEFLKLLEEVSSGIDE